MSKEKAAQQDKHSSPDSGRAAQARERGQETAVSDPLPIIQRVVYASESLSPQEGQTLQRHVGNRAVGQWVVQRKMSLGPVGDRYEQEADDVARQVVSGLAQRHEDEEELQMKPLTAVSAVQRHEEEEELQAKPLLQRQEEEEELQMKPTAVQRHEEEEELQAKPLLQRQEEEEELQMKPTAVQRQDVVGAQGGEVTEQLETAIQQARGGGRPLPGTVRQPMEAAFQADFGAVRVHTDSQSDTLNRSLSARAFTTGQDIFFRANEYSPGTSSGQELLAHELTHTIQQGASPQTAPPEANRSQVQRQPAPAQTTANRVQRRENQSSLAKIINAGVNVSNARGNLGQLGHAMDVWVEIDAGNHPVTPAGAKPGSVYGLQFEYWEYVDVPRDNQGAIGVKPWNDIYGMKPDASTFDTAAPGCDLTWKQAVEQAAAGTLTGKKKIGFRDIPGLFEKANRDVERTLKFRISFNDGTQQREIFATQLLRVNNGRLGYSAYHDSLGNSVEAHGFGANGYAKGSPQEQNALTHEASRLAMDGSALPSNAAILATIPTADQSEVQSFVKELVDNTAQPFVDKEMAEFVSKVDADKQEKRAPQDWMNLISKEFMTDKPGVAAGQYLIPNIPGAQRKQRALPSGGILVALVTGTNILRMYYSDNTAQTVSMNIVPQLAAKNWTINVRSFTEIPTNLVQDSLATYRSVAMGATLKKRPLNAPNAHLRGFTQQGNNHIVKVNDSIGSKIKRNNDVMIFEPEIRDVTGSWLKAKYGTRVGFIRANKIDGTRDAAAWNKAQQGDLPEVKPEEVMEINDVTYLKQLAQTHAANHTALLAGVLSYIRRFSGRRAAVEQAYNSEIPKLGLAVPQTLGELVHGHFVRAFENRGNGAAFYQDLLRRFPEFQYLVKPAYRLVFGETQLQTMLQQIRTDAFATEVPDPNSIENQMDKLLFQINGPYTLTNHVPSTGIGKFDAEYDPLSGQFKVIVKVNFDFVDYTDPNYQLEARANKPLDAKYLQAQWDTTAKRPWIDEFKRQINTIWNGKFRMQCVRPGWADVVATPVMEVREVPDGQQHFKVKVDKAALVNGQKMRTMGGSSYVDSDKGIVQLREFDLVDKIADPSVHAYLHEGEKSGNITPAYKLDRQRLDGLLAQFGRLSYQANSLSLQSPRLLLNLTDAINRTKIPSKLAHLHPIIIEKNMVTTTGVRTNWRLAAVRAQRLQQQLQAAGVQNPIQISLGSESFNGLVVKIAPPDPLIENVYVQNWSRISAAHEFGHMVGLADEYNPAASTEMVQKMISDGLLPPGTPGNHLSTKGASKSSGQGGKQTAFARLLEETNLSAPDFNPDQTAPMSTSLMTGGYELMAQHFVTFWEALTQMTAPYLDKKYWEIR